jgi:hypothetical protein
MIILQNLFQHSKTLLHPSPINLFSFLLKLSNQAEDNPGSLLERAEYRFNQTSFSKCFVFELNT